MKQGKTLGELARELNVQALAKRDYLVDTRSLTFQTTEGVSRLKLPIDIGANTFDINDLAHRQISERLGIPYRYYDRMRTSNAALLDDNINSWLKINPERRMIRTLDGKARAFLSDRYRRLDNFDLAEAVFPVLARMKGAEVISCELTETNMFIKVINKTLEMEVQKGDVVQAGIVISNSEVGLGSLRVEPLIYTLRCLNGMIAQDFSQRKYHVGRTVENESASYELYRDETLQADDKAFYLKVQDVVSAAVDEAKFALIVDRMRQATGQRLQGNPIKAVEVLGQRFQFNQEEQSSILKHLIKGGDLSAYGLLNAVTHTSQELSDYNRATDFERFGGQILTLPKKEWQEIATAA